jgi:general secretion pathway protein D
MVGRRIRLVAAALAVLVSVGCGVGNVAFREGRKAELRKDYDTALVNYEKAVQSDPGNAQYQIHEKLARTQASLFHLKRGKSLLAEGRPDDAAGEFQKAVSIDPTNEAAAQELARLLARQAAAKRAREKALQKALKAGEPEATGGGPELKRLPTEPLAHFRISADSRKVYETLGMLGGINVAFTSDFQPRPVSVDLSNVTIDDALLIVSYQTKTFWRPVTSNTILVVPDTPANRRDYQAEVLKTIYLSNPLAPADRTAITTALKQVLGLQRIVDNPDANAIIIRDTPAKVAAAEKMIHDLDRGKAEILVDVAILEADRNRIRDLGLTQVAASPLQSTNIAGVGFNPSTTITVDSTTIAALPLNRLGHLSTRDFSIVLPGAVANALMSDSHTRILQNPQIRVTDGQTAKLRIGSRIPYATGSFLPSVGGVSGGGGFGLLASTQFQYQDVGVNLDLTPRLLPNGEVSLHAMIEISSLQAPISIGGFSQPTFGQRHIEHDIRLKEGEVNLLGGLIQSSETQSVSGLPGLSQIPFLRYLFSTEHRERIETEVLVMLTPRVIRLPEPAAEGVGALTMGGETEGQGPVPATPPQIEPPPERPGPPR